MAQPHARPLTVLPKAAQHVHDRLPGRGCVGAVPRGTVRAGAAPRRRALRSSPRRHFVGTVCVQPRVESSRRRTRALIALFGLAAAAVVGLMNGLASCLPDHGKADRSRPVSTAEAQRLAGVRLRDQQDGHAGFRATVGPPGAAVHLTGWVDWRRPRLGGVPAGVVAGPAVLPPARMGPAGAGPTPPAASRATYWLDDGSHRRRLHTYLRRALPVRVDFNRDDRAVPAAIAPLGGG